MDVREIEKEIDVFHKDHDAFKYSRATSILNLLRSFEDGCRLIGNMELGLTGSPESMEMNNRFFLDALDMAIKWSYAECVDNDTIDFDSDNRYLTFGFLLLEYAKPYADICTAFISYSRGYFTADVKGKSIKFSILKPIPKILDADYQLEMKQKYSHKKPDIAQHISDLKSIREELISAITNDNGHVGYNITPSIWENTRQVLQFHYEASRELPEEWIIDGFTLSEYCDVWVTLATWMMIHTISCMYSGLPGGALEDVVITKTLEEIIQFVRDKSNASEIAIQKIIRLLVFDCNLKNNDVIYQPIIKLTSDLYGLSPNLFLNSNPERNLISIIHKYQNKTEYSAFTNNRENLMADLIIDEVNCGSWHTKKKVCLPQPLPDIDLLLYDSYNNAVLLCELKWLNAADSTSEVYARQDDIDKGVKQSEDTLKYSKQNIEDCMFRAFDKDIFKDIDWTKTSIGSCVISKNTIRTTLETIPVININQFIELCKLCKFNLKLVLDSLEQRNYLNKLPGRYIETYHKIEYAGYEFSVPVIELNVEASSNKVGRNDPCPCGKVNPISGRPMKYKNCCGRD